MRKYFVAAVVAVMVFAFAAFAASLNVQGGVLQAGADDDLTCTNEVVNVSWFTSNDGVGVWVGGVELDFGNAGCDGLHAQVFLPEASSFWAISFNTISDGKVSMRFDPSHGEIRTWPPGSCGVSDGTIRADAIHVIQVLVKSGLDANEQLVLDTPCGS